MDPRCLISNKMIIDEMTRAAGVQPDATSVENVEARGCVDFYWQRDGFGVGVSIYPHDRHQSLDDFSRRVCEPAIAAWRAREVH